MFCRKRAGVVVRDYCNMYEIHVGNIPNSTISPCNHITHLTHIYRYHANSSSLRHFRVRISYKYILP